MHTTEQQASLLAYQTELMTGWFSGMLNKPITILDYGCGHGLMTNFVQRAFYNATVFGIDQDQDACQYAQQAFPAISFPTQLAFPASFFDIIYVNNVLHHMPREQRQKIINELLYVLKSNGSLVIFELNPLHWHVRKEFKKNPAEQYAELIYPWRFSTLFANKAQWHITFCYPPHALSWMQSMFGKVPFGQLYAIIATRN